ncbi:MAG: helix-turn-helix domain containing protein [Chloroflexi bacterium]|nr:helix-turn-helix domain containing protein [Chloroflexota bacterium]MDA1147084.1 helix-turn-helix domain containing protein [Chloroflexota bacterium]
MTSTPDPDRTLRRDAAQNQARILAVAPLVFAEQGWGASMDEVARRAGVGVGTVYRRFATKEDLVDAVLAERVGLMVQWAEAAAAEADPWTGLVGFIEQMMDAPGGVLAFKSVVQLRWTLEDAQRFFSGFAPLIVGLIERGQRDGRFRADLTLSDLPMLILGLDAIRAASASVAPDLWRRFLGIYLDGMRPEAATDLASPGLTPPQIVALMSGQSEAAQTPSTA